MSYKDWFKEIKWLKDKIILPDGTRISKDLYTSKNGFEIDAFNRMLFSVYNRLYPVSDGRRYKK